MFLSSQAFLAAISLLIAYGLASKQYLLFAIIPLTLFAFIESSLICFSMMNMSSLEASRTFTKLAQPALDESLAEDELPDFALVLSRTYVGGSIIIFIIGFYSAFAALGAYFFLVYRGPLETFLMSVLYIFLFGVAILSSRQILALAFKGPKSLRS